MSGTSHLRSGAVPVVSVIMPTLNAGQWICTALTSLADQDIDLEVIVVDGGSSDNTEELCRSFPFVHYYCNCDSNIYDSVNLALSNTNGKYIAWLNADDVFLPGSLRAMASILDNDPDCDVVRGRARFVQSTGQDDLKSMVSIHEAPARLTLDIVCRGSLAINAMLFRRSAFDQTGLFDPRFSIAADREWMLRAWDNGIVPVELDRDVYVYRIHPDSLTLSGEMLQSLAIRRQHQCILGQKKFHNDKRKEIKSWRATENFLFFSLMIRSGNVKKAVRFLFSSVHSDSMWLFRAGWICFWKKIPRGQKGKIS